MPIQQYSEPEFDPYGDQRAAGSLDTGRWMAPVVETPLDIRLDRLAQRGLAPEAARARIATQSTDAERRALADVVVLNDGSLAALAAHVDRLWGTLAAEAERTR